MTSPHAVRAPAVTESVASPPLFERLYRQDAAVVAFAIDGVPAEARVGDLLVTALLANRSDLRKFEFGPGHRAGFCLMGACQDCWVDLADGRRVRACSTPVEPGMDVLIEGRAR